MVVKMVVRPIAKLSKDLVRSRLCRCRREVIEPNWEDEIVRGIDREFGPAANRRSWQSRDVANMTALGRGPDPAQRHQDRPLDELSQRRLRRPNR